MLPLRYAPFITHDVVSAIEAIGKLGSIIVQGTQQQGASHKERKTLLAAALDVFTIFGNEQARLKEIDAPDKQDVIKCRDKILRCAERVIKYVDTDGHNDTAIPRDKGLKAAGGLAKACKALSGLLGSAAPNLPASASRVLSALLDQYADNMLSATGATEPGGLAQAAQSAAASARRGIEATYSGQFAFALEEEITGVPGVKPQEGKGFEVEREKLCSLIQLVAAATGSTLSSTIQAACVDPNQAQTAEVSTGVLTEEAEHTEPGEEEELLSDVTEDSISTDPEMPPLEGSEEDISVGGEGPAGAQAAAPAAPDTPQQEPEPSPESSTSEDLEVEEIFSSAEQEFAPEERGTGHDSGEEKESAEKKKKSTSKRTPLPPEESREEEKQDKTQRQEPGTLNTLFQRFLILVQGVLETLSSMIGAPFESRSFREIFQSRRAHDGADGLQKRSTSEQGLSSPDVEQGQEGARPRRYSDPGLAIQDMYRLRGGEVRDAATQTPLEQQDHAAGSGVAPVKPPRTFEHESGRDTPSTAGHGRKILTPKMQALRETLERTLGDGSPSTPTKKTGTATQTTTTGSRHPSGSEQSAVASTTKSPDDKPLPPPAPPLPEPPAKAAPKAVAPSGPKKAGPKPPSPAEAMLSELSARLQSGGGLKPSRDRTPSAKAVEKSKTEPTPREAMMAQLKGVLEQRESQATSGDAKVDPRSPSPKPEDIPMGQLTEAAVGLQGVQSQGTVPEGSVKGPGAGGADQKPEAPQR
ncbi:hypothetical protein [Neorickettsia sennetsu]|uniref:Uncharacterized protein n=1 Tax=Ehrlichia sennetsu (strain ATCC VR-367 / Miyayama) TaxID=222891 RepID=Q2GDF9_EHRS3|nr:hypothetical protein [Neorickettsia sennetsu]ABD46331.1 hypothetical protein NSE_0607 [Neorickettsia sennetsu str. Miyayama]